MNSSIKNKVCVITGASKGIGRELSIRFAQEGAFLALNYNKSEKSANLLAQYIEKQYQRRPLMVKADVTKETDIKKFFQIVLEKFGKIDILINNAGMLSDSDIVNMEYEKWKKTLDVNISGMFLCCKYFAQIMIKRKEGNIINMGSGKGIYGSYNQSNYAASKAAVLGFTKALALELGEFGICVNCVCPNFILTDINRENPEKIEKAKCKSVLPIDSGLEDLLNFMVFLSSGMLKGVSGQNFIIDSRIK